MKEHSPQLKEEVFNSLMDLAIANTKKVYLYQDLETGLYHYVTNSDEIEVIVEFLQLLGVEYDHLSEIDRKYKYELQALQADFMVFKIKEHHLLERIIRPGQDLSTVFGYELQHNEFVILRIIF